MSLVNPQIPTRQYSAIRQRAARSSLDGQLHPIDAHRSSMYISQLLASIPGGKTKTISRSHSQQLDPSTELFGRFRRLRDSALVPPSPKLLLPLALLHPFLGPLIGREESLSHTAELAETASPGECCRSAGFGPPIQEPAAVVESGRTHRRARNDIEQARIGCGVCLG